MDSGNSGSLNSSSGGDDDRYDSSRAESVSAFFNSSNQQPPPSPLPPLHHHHHHQNHQQPSNFDPLSTYLDPFSRPQPTQAPNSLLHLDMVWPKNNLIRSELNCTNTNDSLMGSIPSAQPQHGSGRIHFPNPSSISLQPAAAHHENGVRGSSTSSDHHHHHHQTSVTRNGKKRSRASRRAPTTVLTTDTSNFRAMVQEFTGIPAPPFSSSSFPRSRFDLFNTSSALRSGHLETVPPPYLLRPFPHKVQLPSFSTSITTTTTSTTSNSTSTNNYQLPSEIGLSKEPYHQNLLNMQNPIFTFQSLLQPDHQLAHVPMFGDKPKGPGSTVSSSTNSQLKMGALEEFNMSNHGGHVNSHLGGLSNIVTSSNDMSLRSNISTNWGNHNEVVSNNNGDDNHDQSHLSSSFNGNYSNPQRVSTSCKMNFSTSLSDFHTDKGSTAKVNSARGEGKCVRESKQ